MMKDILFLTLTEVVDIHSNQIGSYGGLPGIRDINPLSSAIAMPRASFHGEYLHNDIYEMAAVYGFRIGKNQLFVDGNKRTALVSVLVFLELNGISISDPQEKLYDAMQDLSTGKLNKGEFSGILRKLKE